VPAFDLSPLPVGLHVGTSSFSAADWCGPFYPTDLPPHEFLSHYARSFRTVEIDATWHFMPNLKTVQAWGRKVPDGFIFAAKVPKVITHEKKLVGCEDDWARFLETIDALGPKLGPLLLQFQYVSKKADPREYESGSEFRRRLEDFLPRMPGRFRYVIEVRNTNWLTNDLTSMLRSRNIALAMVDYVRMPRPAAWFDACDPVTADFGYVRFLGDHHSMDNLVIKMRERGEKNRDWDQLVIDRTSEMREWIPILRRLTARTGDVYAYFNNHYAGFAPGSIDLFLKIWDEMREGPDGSRPGSTPEGVSP
jgi:uncharacterized protein YecE (DUF72 family)